jgi:RNA polymerase sigma-70 factor (ECF subfamily)
LGNSGYDPDFAVLFDRHAVAVHRYIARRVGITAADDLLAQTFLVAAGRLADALAELAQSDREVLLLVARRAADRADRRGRGAGRSGRVASPAAPLPRRAMVAAAAAVILAARNGRGLRPRRRH